jgi:DNA-binding Lrp family transcriptional regulator
MITGLVLVRLQAGKESQALTKIKELKGVSHVSAVYGRWDLVVDIEADDLPTMSKVVIEKIRCINGVHGTETLVTTAI